MLGTRQRPAMDLARLPFLLSSETAQTQLDPMASLMRLVDKLEQWPDLWSATPANGHCWADVPDIGVAVAVVIPGTGLCVQSGADRLATLF